MASVDKLTAMRFLQGWSRREKDVELRERVVEQAPFLLHPAPAGMRKKM